jgi:hypothetical protein
LICADAIWTLDLSQSRIACNAMGNFAVPDQVTSGSDFGTNTVITTFPVVCIVASAGPERRFSGTPTGGLARGFDLFWISL